MGAGAAIQTLPTRRILQNALRGHAGHGFIYLNNPKVGCSTIKSSLWAGVRGTPPGRQDDVHVLEGSPFAADLPAPEAARGALVFTFVRNPYQRLVSAWLNKVQIRKDRVWAGFATRRGLDPEAEVSFDHFVEIICALPPEENDPHWRPQHLNALYPLVTPNLVADLDSLDALLPQVLTRIFGAAAPAVAQRRLHGTGARASWRGQFGSAETRARVQAFYAGDCAAYGYAVEIDADAGPALPRWSDAGHDGLAALARYLQAEPGAEAAALRGLEAADQTGALRDWMLGQRLRRPRLHQTTRAALLRDHGDRIAGSAHLRAVVERAKAGARD